MAANNQCISFRLKHIDFRRICLPNQTGDSADTTTSAEILFTIVPRFHTIQIWQSPTTAAFEFLRQLPLITPSTLPEDKLACPICWEPYILSAKPIEMPTILPCQHILGRKCISLWIFPVNERPKNTCPMCRAELFNEAAFDEALASPIEESDLAEWLKDTIRCHQKAPHGRVRTEFLMTDLERIGKETDLRVPGEMDADIASWQRMLHRFREMARISEERIVELVDAQAFEQLLRRAERAELERVENAEADLTTRMRAVSRHVTGAVTDYETGGGGTEGGGTDGDGEDEERG